MSNTFTYDNNKDIRKYVDKYKFDVNDFKDIFINCEYYKTRNSWGHKAIVRSNKVTCEAKIRYYNRTWECYTYQSILFKILDMYATHLTGIDYYNVLVLSDNELKDFKELKRRDFMSKYTWFSADNYRETKKHLIRINEIEK